MYEPAGHDPGRAFSFEKYYRNGKNDKKNYKAVRKIIEPICQTENQISVLGHRFADLKMGQISQRGVAPQNTAKKPDR